MTYDECMATYVPVSNANLVRIGTFDPSGTSVDELTGEYVPNHNGLELYLEVWQ